MSLFPVRPGPYRLVLASLALTVAACSSTEGPAPVVPARSIELPGRHLVHVADRDAGATIVLDAAQELRVTLRLEDVDVTGGFEWSLVDMKPGVLSASAVRFETETRDHADSVGGTAIWNFVPQAPGSVALRFELRRPRSLDPAIRTTSFGVRVKQ